MFFINVEGTDNLLESFDDSREGHLIDESLIVELLNQSKTSDSVSWPLEAFKGAINALAGQQNAPAIRLLVRRGRNISKDTGTLLSPDDRRLGNEYSKETVITAYRLNGAKEQGWAGKPFWVLNIKLPEGMVYHRGQK